MTAPTMPVKAIKHILAKELDDFCQGADKAVRDVCIADVPRNLVYLARTLLEPMLAKCESYDDLQNYLDTAGYRMSLEEWVNSL